MNNSTLSAAAKGPHRDLGKEQAWRQILERFVGSGQSVRAFCAAHGVRESAFYYWRGEIQRRDEQARGHRSASSAFAPVVVQPPALSTAEAGLRLRLGAGRELLMPASWPIERVAALLRAIEGAGEMP